MDGQAQRSSPPQQVLRDLSDSGEVLPTQAKGISAACESQVRFSPDLRLLKVRQNGAAVCRERSRKRGRHLQVSSAGWVAREAGARRQPVLGVDTLFADVSCIRIAQKASDLKTLAASLATKLQRPHLPKLRSKPRLPSAPTCTQVI